jgi:hypothetical protein
LNSSYILHMHGTGTAGVRHPIMQKVQWHCVHCANGCYVPNCALTMQLLTVDCAWTAGGRRHHLFVDGCCLCTALLSSCTPPHPYATPRHHSQAGLTPAKGMWSARRHVIILFTPAQLGAIVGASPFAFWREDLNLLMYPV